MNLTDFDALSFDCYGTLIDREARLTTISVDRRGKVPGHSATPVPANVPEPDWTFPSMQAFVDVVESGH